MRRPRCVSFHARAVHGDRHEDHGLLGLLNDAPAWVTFGAIVALATLGKLGGSALAARAMGMDWTSAFVLGALMNTRGLMELIALKVGYDLGVISPQFFSNSC